ncbi:hypothetical protein [uncultured Clostridium sp.]
MQIAGMIFQTGFRAMG